MNPISGLHHVTAIVADAQRTLAFYTERLGLRLVKRTVNFDDSGSYHLYFGDDQGSPGTILTFFAWPGASRGALGTGETQSVALSVPAQSIPFWAERLRAADIAVEQATIFGESVLRFADPDGMKIELVEIFGKEAAAQAELPARHSGVPAEHAVRGFAGVTLSEVAMPATERLLVEMGFARVGAEGARHRFAAPGQELGNRIDLVVTTGSRGRMGAGTIHHIAFRNADDAAQEEWRSRLTAFGMQPTPVMDRTYFHSIYFREPGGVLFEMATDPPGFALDEPVETLGESLKLPEWLEPQRASIEKHLPSLSVAGLNEVSR